MSDIDELQNKKEKLKLLIEREEMEQSLPHLYGFNLYKWQADYIRSINHYNFLTAGNQLGKSICNGIKWVTWATDKTLWPILWPHRIPKQFWVLMPTKDMILKEFETKWVPEFLPRGKYKSHQVYGWEAQFKSNALFAIRFKSGITVFFLTYETDVHHLQAGSVDAIFLDEEIYWELMPELLMRISATRGYFNGVMTLTRGQIEWQRVFYKTGKDELFPDAFKQVVSAYDCLHYEDGTPSKWTVEEIKNREQMLGTQAEIDLRIHGRAPQIQGLKYPSFNRDRNIVEPIRIPNEWLWYSGVDLGSGGNNHKASICIVAVRPDYKLARVVKVWKGDGQTITTAGDVLEKYLELRGKRQMTGEYYDWASADFGNLASRSGQTNFEKAEKSHTVGENLLNTLFKNAMLLIEESPGHLDLVEELETLSHETKKIRALDDAIDSLRYAVTRIPFSLDDITAQFSETPQKKVQSVDDMRRFGVKKDDRDRESVEQEIDFWNSMLE